MAENHPHIDLSPSIEHSCEICGVSGLTDDSMREHTRQYHVEGSAFCPFCGMGGVDGAELLLHVNQAHLDYLTPENELMSFIDDQSPSVDGDSGDSMSECRGLSPSITEVPGIEKMNGIAHSNLNHNQTNGRNAKTVNDHYQNGLKSSSATTSGHSKSHLSHCDSCSSSSGSSSSNAKSKNGDQKVCDMSSGNKEFSNGFATSNGSQGSPLRSQLGLNLKSNAPATSMQSPMQCPICPYTSESASILEEHINRSHFDPLSPSVVISSNHSDTLTALACPICGRAFESSSDLELHVNIEHRDILSPARIDKPTTNGSVRSMCPVCCMSLDNMKTDEMELHIEKHFAKSPVKKKTEPDLEKEAQKLREQREFEMLRAQYGMDDQGNFREQSSSQMQRAVYAGEMSVADYYERQVGLRAAESHGIDDGTSCTKSVAPRVLSLSSSAPGVIKSLLCSSVDHYGSSYGDKGWGCGYRNLQMLLSSLLQNTTYNEAIYSAWGTHGPSRTAMPSISRLQKMVEAAWTRGFDVQGSEQLGCKLHNTRKWIGATEVVTVLSWLRIHCQLIDFHRPTSPDGRHTSLFNWVLKYFSESKNHTPPLYLQHQGHSRTIIGIEQRTNHELTLLILDPSHGPRQVAALGSSQDSLRLIRRGPAAMRAPQYQIVAVRGLIDTEEQYQASKVLRSLRIPADC
ncbi:zinc finger-containing ubiquitin peptidase 1-like isoform X2 [Bradysia coprophila]|uniref:zinc finger-containing ubiquitin peptidase 1-like isoform X2 n=1 Tax=Bradysia coprophila TaxID=38358 RepID=UPI00187DC1EE|nr:zinc finger-containing ubiquitin peptidase 1-like isoform X2 [Bradysia coprophila]